MCPDPGSVHDTPPRNATVQHRHIPGPSQTDHARPAAGDTRATFPLLSHPRQTPLRSSSSERHNSHCISISRSNAPSSLSSSHCASSRAVRFCRAGSTFPSASLTWSNISPRRGTSWLGSGDAAVAVDLAEEGTSSIYNRIRSARKERKKKRTTVRTLDRNHEIAQRNADRVRLDQQSIIRRINLGIPPLNRIQRRFCTQRLGPTRQYTITSRT